MSTDQPVEKPCNLSGYTWASFIFSYVAHGSEIAFEHFSEMRHHLELCEYHRTELEQRHQRHADRMAGNTGPNLQGLRTRPGFGVYRGPQGV